MPLVTSEVSSSYVERSSRPVAAWLFLCCVMIFVMVVLGGATRLTHSGLSIVEWKPLTGIIPPLTEAQWQAAFTQYQQYPEFNKINANMDLPGFKSIFWLEFIHRLWGRLIGIVFLVPFVYFLARGLVSQQLLTKLVAIFVLGALQGALGWYMVASGLIERPDVSQYRLAAHLALAFFVYGFIFWTALGLIHPHPLHFSETTKRPLRHAARLLLALVFLVVLSGAFVAGIDAGFAFNTFPLMDGRWIPDGLLMLEPTSRNFFENLITVQFTHRVLAIAVFLYVVLFWARTLWTVLPARVQNAVHVLLAAVLLQVSLGISTLLLVVPVPLAVAHQAGALLLFTVALWVVHELKRGAW